MTNWRNDLRQYEIHKALPRSARLPRPTTAMNARAAADRREFAGRVWTASLIVAAVVGGILLIWIAIKVVLVFFASVLLGIFLRVAADCVQHVTKWGRRRSFAVAVPGLLCLAAAGGWLLASPISSQVTRLSAELPKVVQHDEDLLRQYSWGRSLMDYLQNSDGFLSQAGGVLQKIPTVFSISLQGLIDFLVILFAGFYLAYQPGLYIHGLLRLVPPGSRARAREAVDEIGWGLRRWLLGQVVSMMIMGALSWGGLLLIGVPGSGILAIISGLLDFVAVVGTLAATAIAVVFALLKSPTCALYVVCLYAGLHLLETNVVIPMIQKRTASVPPVLTVFAMMLFFTLFGFVGLLLAVPLLTLCLIATRTLLVEQVIEQPPASPD